MLYTVEVAESGYRYVWRKSARWEFGLGERSVRLLSNVEFTAASMIGDTKSLEEAHTLGLTSKPLGIA